MSISNIDIIIDYNMNIRIEYNSKLNILYGLASEGRNKRSSYPDKFCLLHIAAVTNKRNSKM